MPRYEEIAAELREQIARGEYRAGDTLPRYEDLTATYGVGRGVIASAIGLLEREGLVRPVKKRGLVVLDRPERRRVMRGQTISRDPKRGYVFPAASHKGEPWEVHGQPVAARVPAPARVAELLDISVGTPTLCRHRVTSPAGEPPFQVVETWISDTALADAPQAGEPSTGPGGYLDRLEEAGHGPLTWTEHIRVRMPTSEEASALEISPAMPVLETVIVGTSARDGSTVEVTTRAIPADRVELISSLRRDRSAAWPTKPISA